MGKNFLVILNLFLFSDEIPHLLLYILEHFDQSYFKVFDNSNIWFTPGSVSIAYHFCWFQTWQSNKDWIYISTLND